MSGRGHRAHLDPGRIQHPALREIVRESPVPIVADIHFHYKRAIEAAEAGAACLRINPGNIGERRSAWPRW
jgi:(E)-4-hydroxy-3-methylbut-2-enyl-diphosphate synthase